MLDGLRGASRRCSALLVIGLAMLASVSSLTAPAAASPLRAVAVGRAVASEPGPHSPIDRRPARTKVVHRDGVVVRSVDLGDIALGSPRGRYRAPVRGVLVSPDRRASHAKLIIVNHLRYPNCAGSRFAYPCPRGHAERRFDKGMTYLGVAMAKRGFSVLIPDLGPLYIGGDLDDPYDQGTGLARSLDRLVGALERANAGKRTRWGHGLRGDIDTSRLGLLAHSRSAPLASGLIRSWKDSAHPITTLMTYGGFYESYYHGESGATPMVPDLPYLGVVGDQDRDTPYMAPMWLTHHVSERRKAAALVAVVPGLGHTYINRTLSRARIDDRICDDTCRNAATHRRFLIRTATAWFNTTLRHRRTLLPLRAADPLPPTLGGLPAHWLAATNGRGRNVFLAGKRGKLRTSGAGARARTCFPAEPMAPAHNDDCPFPERGVIQNADEVTQVRLTPHAGVVLRVRPTRGVKLVSIHLSPSDDRADHATGSPLQVRVVLANGRHIDRQIPPGSTLVDRATPSRSGVYSIGTIRLSLPRWVARQRIVALKLTGGTTTSQFDIRAIDLATRVSRR